MKLESININRFRSIESSELRNCGGFNVLIGQNNSGKSSILSAIHAFFTCIQDGNVITLNPCIGKEIDFFEKKTQLPIEITMVFSLLLADRDALIRDIVTEAPQMKNAVDGIDPSLRLYVTINIMPPPDSFGFVKKIVLGGTVKPGLKHPDPETIILSIDKDTALELYKKFSKAYQNNKSAEALLRIDTETLRSLFNRLASREEITLASFLKSRRFFSSNISNELIQTLESRLGESQSIEDLKTEIQTLASSIKEQAIALQKEPLKNKVDTFSGEESLIPGYVQSLLHRIAEIHVLYLTERRKQIGQEEAERLRSLKVKRGGPEVLRNIQETVSALLGVQVDAFDSSSPSNSGEIPAEMDVDNFLVEVNGSGIKEALRLVLDVEFGHPDILLVEEPEIHLHPALETSMMRYLKRVSCQCQIFITTHSTNFLDTAEMNNVYLVSKPQSTRVQHLNVEEAEEQIPQELGIRLSSLFMFDRLVFVEGQSDEDILREWASKLGINFSQSNVGFIAMGGVRNFAHFATEATLSFLTKRQVKMWFLMDRDEREDSEVSKLEAALGQNATVKILEKREIENYLIYPKAIIKFIKFKQESLGIQNKNDLPTEAEINEKIDECAEKLKQFAINKRVSQILCKPVYPSLRQIFQPVQENVITTKIAEEIQQMIEGLQAQNAKV